MRDDNFNWNLGIALAEDYKDGEEGLLPRLNETQYFGCEEIRAGNLSNDAVDLLTQTETKRLLVIGRAVKNSMK